MSESKKNHRNSNVRTSVASLMVIVGLSDGQFQTLTYSDGEIWRVLQALDNVKPLPFIGTLPEAGKAGLISNGEKRVRERVQTVDPYLIPGSYIQTKLTEIQSEYTDRRSGRAPSIDASARGRARKPSTQPLPRAASPSTKPGPDAVRSVREPSTKRETPLAKTISKGPQMKITAPGPLALEVVSGSSNISRYESKLAPVFIAGDKAIEAATKGVEAVLVNKGITLTDFVTNVKESLKSSISPTGTAAREGMLLRRIAKDPKNCTYSKFVPPTVEGKFTALRALSQKTIPLTEDVNIPYFMDINGLFIEVSSDGKAMSSNPDVYSPPLPTQAEGVMPWAELVSKFSRSVAMDNLIKELTEIAEQSLGTKLSPEQIDKLSKGEEYPVAPTPIVDSATVVMKVNNSPP